MPASSATAMEQDFGPLLDAKIPENTKLAQSGKLADAIENLLAIEKQTRNAEDTRSTSKVATTIIKLCMEAKQWDLLSEKLVQLSKRRGQLKMVVRDMVEAVMNELEKVADKETRINIINTLRTITEGKIYVEIERARLTRILSKMKEDEGKIQEAAKILQELQVETFSQMEKREKVDFLLEQVRLCLDNKDYIRAQIMSNKIQRKLLQDPEFQDLKLRFYEHMIRYYSHDSNYLEICRCYQSIYDTPNVKADKQKWIDALQKMCTYAILAPHDNTQSDLLHRISEDKNLEELPKYKDLLKSFITVELIRWPRLKELYANEMAAQLGTQSSEPKGLWADFHKRVVEHNVRVIATYYTKISLNRLSELLDLPQEEAEKFVSDLVVGKSIFAKIDRPAGVITFVKKQDPSETLNDWSDSVGNLLDLLEKTNHLIHRELMVHNLKL